MTDTLFSALSLPPAQLENLNAIGYSEMTPIQAQSLPQVLAGKDLIAKAKTGSGKTAAFGIGLLDKLAPSGFFVQALVLCPTRELATQVAKELRKLARYRQNTKIVTICGGQPIGPQIGSLEHGAHVVVGTPGRIKDHLRKGTLRINRINTLVLDEADRMLDMGFSDDIQDILEQTPSNRQTLLFSATYPKEIRQISDQYQRDPVEVSVESFHSDSQISQRFYRVEKDQKTDALIRLLGHHRPVSSVVFCNTRQQCNDISQALKEAGHVARPLHGDLDQKDRDMVLTQFANGSCSVLVATDVAARGLDIDDLSAVVNYDLPKDPEIYIHRIGRTGRAGKEGMAISLHTEREEYKMEIISEYQQAELPRVSIDQISSRPEAPQPPRMATLCIAGGRKDKVRPGDILGALTGEAGIPGTAVGKIDVVDYFAYVAVERKVAREALDRLRDGKIKGRKFKVRRL